MSGTPVLSSTLPRAHLPGDRKDDLPIAGWIEDAAWRTYQHRLKATGWCCHSLPVRFGTNGARKASSAGCVVARRLRAGSNSCPRLECDIAVVEVGRQWNRARRAMLHWNAAGNQPEAGCCPVNRDAALSYHLVANSHHHPRARTADEVAQRARQHRLPRCARQTGRSARHPEQVGAM